MSSTITNKKTDKKPLKIALAGNPNAGKTSLFNLLTGLNQQVGNFPGITVDKKTGKYRHNNTQADITDLPGTYSLYPASADEQVVKEILANPNHQNHPELIIFVADATNLERSLLLFSQIADLGLPMVVVLTMTDLARKYGLKVNPVIWQTHYPQVPLLQINTRTGKGLSLLKSVLDKADELTPATQKPNIAIDFSEASQVEDTTRRYQHINELLAQLGYTQEKRQLYQFTSKLDRWLLHPVLGYIIFVALLVLVFQAVFAWSQWPMQLIDEGFIQLSEFIENQLPAGLFTELLAEGIVPGLGGILIFVPQIAVLFLLLTILEETGYMARVVFLADRLVKPFGLNGRSVVPLLSGAACAIPAIMAARTIQNRREWLTTIFVTPFMSCSARLPVYTLLIALAVPDQSWGVFNWQGLTLMGLYLLGTAAAMLSAMLVQLFIKKGKPGFLILEMPLYRLPYWQNAGLVVWQKVRIFVWETGKIILAISIVLWFLSSFGPATSLPSQESSWQPVRQPLEQSYAGHLGHFIEPAVQPLGYDWKIGIALITSFAAREVFTGTIATLYSTQDKDIAGDEAGLLARLQEERGLDSQNTFRPAVAFSLMVFYAFAMQCMGTFAVMVRETKSYKQAFIQMIYMTGLAYLSAWGVYQWLS